MKVNEIKIKLPWGYAAAKTWGDHKNPVVIALHGYQDNANTFDKLIPLLPPTHYYICIDLPSHGKSTHLPTELIPSLLDYVITLKLILDTLNRQKYILMGHSFGARTSIFFAQIYPEYVSKLIALDATYYFPVEPDKLPDYYRDIFRQYEKSLKNKNRPAPTYTEDEVIKRALAGRYSEISEPSGRILMQRSLIPVGNDKYKISTAQHLKYCSYLPLSCDYILQMLRMHSVGCPHLVIAADEGEGGANEEVLKEFAKNKNFEFHLVKGKHDIHMDEPEKVAPIISKFLVKFPNKF